MRQAINYKNMFINNRLWFFIYFFITPPPHWTILQDPSEGLVYNMFLHKMYSLSCHLSKQLKWSLCLLYADSWTKFYWEEESNLRSFLNVLLKVMFSNCNGGPYRAQNSQDKGTGLIRPVKSSAESSFWSLVTFSCEPHLKEKPIRDHQSCQKV